MARRTRSEIRDRNFTSSLARGLKILEAFAPGHFQLGITELSRRTGLSKSTVFRLVHTLRSLGYLIFVSEEEKYALGPRVLNLGFAVLGGLELREIARPYLHDLSRRVNETVNLAILDGWELVYIERIKTQQIVNINLHVGSRLPLYNTSMGRSLAAFQSASWLTGYLRYLRQFPEAAMYWKRSGRKLKAILDKVRAGDYAVNNEELSPGLRSVAAPVRNKDGGVAGAVNIAVSSSIYSLARLNKELLPPLKETARAISLAVGFDGTIRGTR